MRSLCRPASPNCCSALLRASGSTDSEPLLCAPFAFAPFDCALFPDTVGGVLVPGGDIKVGVVTSFDDLRFLVSTAGGPLGPGERILSSCPVCGRVFSGVVVLQQPLPPQRISHDGG